MMSIFPYEAKFYYDALEMMRKWPDLRGIYLNGDIAEIESVSRHPKHPLAQKYLLKELEYVNTKFDLVQRMFKDIPVEFIEGNHCYRIFRHVRDITPELWGMLHTPTLFRFDERPNWKFTPYGPNQWVKCGKTRDLYVRHEPLQMGLNHAKGTAERSMVSVIYGHVHQISQFTHKKHGPKPLLVTAYANGWLGDIKADCFSYRGPRDNWASGFARIDCEENGDYEVRTIRF